MVCWKNGLLRWKKWSSFEKAAFQIFKSSYFIELECGDFLKADEHLTFRSIFIYTLAVWNDSLTNNGDYITLFILLLQNFCNVILFPKSSLWIFKNFYRHSNKIKYKNQGILQWIRIARHFLKRRQNTRKFYRINTWVISFLVFPVNQ